MNNETIKKMAEECITEDQFAVGAFVALIVNECADVVSTFTFDKDKVAEIRHAIKAHFGIE
jgi:hypothetical protein